MLSEEHHHLKSEKDSFHAYEKISLESQKSQIKSHKSKVRSHKSEVARQKVTNKNKIYVHL